MAVYTRYIDAVLNSGFPLVGEFNGLFYDIDAMVAIDWKFEVVSVEKILPRLDEYISEQGKLKVGDFIVVVDDEMITGGYVREVCTNETAKLVNSFDSREFIYVIPSEEIA